MKHLQKIVHIKLKLLVLIVLPIILFTLITSNSPIIANIRSFVVMSASMEPTIPVGSVVFVQKQSHYTVGDIVTFIRGETTITHRINNIIIDKNKAVQFQTKGDANNTPDTQSLIPSQIIGKSFFSIPYFGSLIIFIKSPLGFVTFIIIPVIIFISFEIWTIKKELEKQIEKRVLKNLGKI